MGLSVFGARRRAAPVYLAVLSLLAAAASCSLDLDESLIGMGRDGGLAVPDAQPEPHVDADVDVGAPIEPYASTCTNDDECTEDHGCVTGRCDVPRGRCVYEVCRPAACSAGACDESAGTCGAPTAYTFLATQFTVGAPLACAHCAAAVHPWLFIVTTTGVVAFNTSNPANSSPPTVPVVGLGFIPSALVQSGGRVWMLGGVSGAGPSRIQLAYVDAPVNPLSPVITARTVLASYNRPAEGTSLFARGGGSALLVGHAPQFPATIVDAPLDEPAAISATPVPAPPEFAPTAVSGGRLLMSAVIDQSAQVVLIDAAGSPNPVTKPVVHLADAAAVSTQRAVAASADGAIFWATGVHHAAGPVVTTRAARGYFLVPNAAGEIEGNVGLDLEVYDTQPVAANAAVFGPHQATSAMLDAKTAMVAARARDDDQHTVVLFVDREPLGAPRRHVLPVPIAHVAAATASNGIGYLVANEHVGQSPSTTVYVFDPACPP